MRRRIALFLVVVLLTYCCSCGITFKTIEGKGEMPFYYETVYCNDVQATTRIAVVDGKLYCKWLDMQYDEDGIQHDTEHIDVIDNIETSRTWERLSIQSESETVVSVFDKAYNYPIYEKIGRFIVLTDEYNHFYLLDTETGIRTDLQLSLEDWRMFATDNINCFAVLSAFSVWRDGKYQQEIRMYTLNQK